MDTKALIEIPKAYTDYADSALVRVGYLYPNVKLRSEGASVEAELPGGDEDLEESVRRDLLHQLYREKIYQETLPIRKWILSDE